MISILFLFAISPAEIKMWAEAIVIYVAAASAVITAFVSAFVAGATALLRFLHFFLPILERWYPREGAGDWRPQFWSFMDNFTWTVQRCSGAGHLPSQKEVLEKSKASKETVSNA